MEKKIKFVGISADLVDLNEGQVPGLPKNPRCWTYEDVSRLQRSILETPELLQARGVLVYPYEGRYVAVGGNMRLSAIRRLKIQEVPCVVLPEDISIEKLKEMAIKDNGQFGSWDEELLKTEWSEIEFAEWGIDVFTVVDEELSKEKVSDQIDDGTKTFEITFSQKEFDFVNKTLRALNPNSEEALLTILGYYDREA